MFVVANNKKILADLQIRSFSCVAFYSVNPLSAWKDAYMAQGGTLSPGGRHSWLSSSSGHWAPPPTGSCLMSRLRVWMPGEMSGLAHVFEQGVHPAHSPTMQSLGMRHGLWRSGRLQWGH